MIDTNNIKVGDKVHYDPLKQYNTLKKYENGIVKEIIDHEYIRVVYHCNNDWENYQNYTGAMTATRDLYYGWI
jgi:hypothetical protein